MSNIATALAIQEGVSQIVFSDESMQYAAAIAQKSGFDPEVMQLLMQYSSTLSAGVATKIVEIVMPKSEFSSMMDELKEMGEFDGLEDM
jgi:hypothetical protein